MRGQTIGRRAAALCGMAVVTVAFCGCATFKLPDALGPGPGAKKAQRRQEAVRLFEESRTKAELESARACWERGDAKGCEDLLTRVLARRKDNREALLLYSEVCLHDRRYDQARQQLETILAAAPKDAEALLALAHALDASGETARALDAYRLASEAEPENEDYALAYNAALDAAGRGPGKGSAGDSDARSARADRSGSAENAKDSLWQRGSDALAKGDAEAAVAAFRKAADQNPDNPQIPLQAAGAAIKAGRPDIAIELVVPLEGRLAGSAEYYRMLGLAYCRSGDYAASQVALQQGLSLDKSSAVSYFLLGCTLLKMGETQRAEESFRQARSLDPRYTAAR